MEEYKYDKFEKEKCWYKKTCKKHKCDVDTIVVFPQSHIHFHLEPFI